MRGRVFQLKESQMRKHLAVSILLAACVVASAAIAAPDKVVATFETLGASGVTGEVVLDPMPNGDLRIHAQLDGLDPNTEYTVFLYDASGACADATTTIEEVTFTSNPAGKIVINERVEAIDIADVQSVGVRLGSDNSLVACASLL
jgi:hypothetical protein